MVKDEKETRNWLLSLVRFIVIIIITFYLYFKFNLDFVYIFIIFIGLVVLTDFRLEKKLIQEWRAKHGNRNKGKG